MLYIIFVVLNDGHTVKISKYFEMKNRISLHSFTLRSSSFGKASTTGQTQTDLGRGFILLPPQAVVLPGLHASSDGVEPVSGFAYQNRQISCLCNADV